MPYLPCEGYELHYLEMGQGPLLLLLPDTSESHHHYRSELRHFSTQFRAVCLDLPGTGLSDALPVWPKDYWDRASDHAMALVDHLGEERCLLVGSGGGAVIGLKLALYHPDRVDAVVADSCMEKLSRRFLERISSDRQWRYGRAWKNEKGWVAKLRRTIHLYRQRGEWKRGHHHGWQSVLEAESALWRLHAEAGGLDFFRGRLSEIRCPVLLTASLEDPYLEEPERQIQTMAAQIPGSRSVLSPLGAHPFMRSRTSEFRRVVDQFFKDFGLS